MTTLSPIEARIIITALNGIFPSKWEDYLEEKDQRDHYHVVKDHFQNIRDYLEFYFNGNPKPDFGYLNDLYDGYFIYYLKLYDLIFHCWQDLISTTDLESPGRLLIDILEADANRMLLRCLSPYQSTSIKKDSDQRIKTLRKIGRKRKKTAKLVKDFDRAYDNLESTLNKFLLPDQNPKT